MFRVRKRARVSTNYSFNGIRVKLNEFNLL